MSTGADWTEVVRRRLNAVSSALDDARMRLRVTWRLHRPRSGDILRWPLVRRYSAWFGEQSEYMQIGLLAFSLAMAFLLSVAAGYMGIRPPAALTAKAEAPTHELAAVLYEWQAQQPALPSTKCAAYTPKETCWRQLSASADKWQAAFAGYMAAIQAEQRHAVWKREGKDFPAYNEEAGVITFTLALEGASRADEKTCRPFRVIAEMPPGVTTGTWPDQRQQAAHAADIRQRLKQVIAKPKLFPHPCLWATEWTAWARIEPATAHSWAASAKEKGWQLEMFFRLHEVESPLLPNWDEDARLTDADFLKEQRVWLWVDEVRLVIGDLVVHTWR